jgi:hypothetical protein
MPFSQFDAQTKALLIAALDAAWLAVGDISDWSVERRANTTRRFTDQLLAAADAGERDHDRLVKAALHNIDRRPTLHLQL